MNLGLGTVQFGFDYGVSNRDGRTPPDEVARILAHAGREGVRLLDTAALYGDSETVLGAVLETGHPFRIVTKTVRFGGSRITGAEAAALRSGYERSLARLRQDRLYGLLIHAVEDLVRPGGELLWSTMIALRREKLVDKIGVSVYSGSDIDAVLGRFQPDLVQVPINVLDQRLVTSGHLERMKKLEVEIHARSVFLQGLLLMDGEALPPYFSPFRAELRQVQEFCRRHGVPPLAMALDFVKSVAEIDTAIVGVTRLDQLRQILAALNDQPAGRGDYAALACNDEQLVNPALWGGT